jgi:thiamine-phosphate pyrophosphorylase
MLRYAITDRAQLGADETARRSALLACLARWAALGVELVQLREKDLPAAELLALARDVHAVLSAHSSPTKLLLNAPPSIALEAAAYIDGLHLTSSHTVTPTKARQLLSASPTFRQRSPLLSISCHTPEQVRAAALAGVDLILFGPVFGKSVLVPEGVSDRPPGGRQPVYRPIYRPVTPPIGLAALRTACTLAGKTPVLALGGVTSANTALCLDAGAAGIAGIRLFQQSEATPKSASEPTPQP